MKRWACLLAIVPLLGHAEEFRSRAPIALQAGDPFQRIQLPFEAYRDTRLDLGDLRVLNGKGEAVAMAYVGEAVPEKEKPTTVRLPQFAVTSPSPGVASPGRVDVRVRTLPDGTLSVEQRALAKAPRTPGASHPTSYLLDASQLKVPVGQFIFDWEQKPGAEIVKVNVEASDDLRDWRTITSRATLVRLEQGGLSLAQNQVPVHGMRAKYYRVTWDGNPAFVLKAVDAESAPATTQPKDPRKTTAARATKTKEGDFVFDLGARLPVEAIRVVFPEINSVGPFEIAVRDSKDGVWRVVSAATFYRISRNGAEIESPPLEVGVVPAREVRLHPQVKSAGDGQAPSIEVQWRPAEIIFIAKGDPPFTLAFGDAKATGTSIPISNLMPNYERGAERKLAFAVVGQVTTEPPPPPPTQLFGMPPRKLALWAVLVIGVLVLAFMAYRLHGQMKAPRP